MNFQTFKHAVAAQFALMSQHELYRTNVTGDQLWETYLSSFPEGTNPIYRKRTEHDCGCCRQFIRAVGNVVAIIDGKMVSIWDVELPAIRGYKDVASALSKLVKSAPIDNLFRTTEKQAGQDKNFEQMVDGVKTWNHFHVIISQKFILSGPAIGPFLGEMRARHDVLKRSLETISIDAVDTVLELIAQNSLYRGEEHKFAVQSYQTIQRNARAFNPTIWDNYIWKTIATAPTSVSKIRNTSIGTLLVALSEGVEMEDAVKSFEAMVAPANYKRPTALVTAKMIASAKATLDELNLTPALERRYATINDITINNILFANRNARSVIEGDVFDQLAKKATKPKLDKVEDVSIEKFLSDILPKAESIEVMVENRHATNLVSLIAPANPTAPSMFKWDNGFSWSYNGEFADSIKERVKAAGGNVTGELCCRLAWEYSDDLDFHMREFGGDHIYYGNRRQKSMNGGMLDVDANGADGLKEHPVENIFYDRISTMRDGAYRLQVNNYSRRSQGVGFIVEIDILGTVHTFEYDKVLASQKTIDIATLHKKGSEITIEAHLPSTQTSRKVWGIDTMQFVPVTVAMMSPNHWDGQGVGNKHYFFMLENCLNEGKARGFFNEFLKDSLTPHRKVIEMVGTKMLTDESQNQLSGLGFSSTQRNELLCRVKGAFTRTVRITF